MFRSIAENGEPKVWFNVGNELRDLGETDGAIRAYYLAIAAGAMEAALNLGGTLESVGDFAEALRVYRIGATDGDRQAAHQLAFLLREIGRQEEAEEVMRDSRLTGDDFADAVLAVWESMDEHDPSLEFRLRAGIDVYPAARTALVAILVDSGREVEAIELLRDGVLRQELDSFIVLGNLYRDFAGDSNAAELAYRSGAELGDSHCEFNLAKLLYDVGRADEVRPHLERAAAAGDDLARNALRTWRLN
ncbi:lipopolysaccharide assembly protein LapB [Jatrophihabitans sp. GAS493]|uniref:tetratricopeptide repeat protein n=1 Tax=Jatrophihabitans sp. GAS493 TaxID=1907575 RepID=UPI0012FDB3BC|nr:tetratricopeptide repeat protein [Jatrophihabitans sp. GAS493]